jgi:hypothetical protein
MERKTKRIATTAAAVVLVAGAGIGIATAAGAAGGDDSQGPITGSELKRASSVALESTGGGRVTGSEIHDEEGYYEVEVTLDSGKQVDVHLDQSFHVLDSSADREGDKGADSGR